MAHVRKLIVFELNKVSFKIFDRVTLAHRSSSVVRVLATARQFVAGTPDTIHLPPRILSDHSGRKPVDTAAFAAATLPVPVPSYMPEVPDSLARWLN